MHHWHTNGVLGKQKRNKGRNISREQVNRMAVKKGNHIGAFRNILCLNFNSFLVLQRCSLTRSVAFPNAVKGDGSTSSGMFFTINKICMLH